MQSITEGISTGIALMLAATAAFLSVPAETAKPWQISQWMQLSICPEADAMAGAIGEQPGNSPAP